MTATLCKDRLQGLDLTSYPIVTHPHGLCLRSTLLLAWAVGCMRNRRLRSALSAFGVSPDSGRPPRIPEVHAGVDHPTHSHTIHERASANVKGDRNVHKATRGIKGMRVQVATMPVSACASAECGGPLGSPAAHGAVVGWREPPT